MRAALATISLLTLSLTAGASAQASPARKSPPSTKAPVQQATVATPAASQPTAPSAAPWKAILRVVPNPLPPGRCASASVEIQDPDGYRATTLSNGATIDFHQFLYQASDTSMLKWRDGKPVFGVICAPANATPAKTSISVTLPDGLVASVDLAALGPGQSAANMMYPAQGQLRPASLPAAQMVTVSAAPLAASPMTTAATAGAGPPIGLDGDDANAWSGTLTVDAGSVPARLIRGGSATMTVVGSGATKHGGNVSYEPMVVSLTLTPSLVPWINSAWQAAPTRMSGTMIAQDAAATSVAGHLAFTDALVTSTWIPDLSTGSKSSGVIITLAPEYVRAATAASPAAAQLPVPPISAFRFAISGLSNSGVKGIKTFEVQTQLPVAEVGEVRDYQHVQITPVFSDVFVTLDERSAADWIAWYKDFVIGGNSTASSEKTFTLDLMNSSSPTPIASVKAYGVGIVSLHANPAANAHGSLIAELYVKRMELVTTANK
ncbi:MAG TPA: hypothetical protein VGO46_01895 [Gemmatimonadaceae bacterium]|nr:hypothetical protein [Gemmatimonadaceae bacterium]